MSLGGDLSLIRLHVLAEGQTEEGFVNGILKPALAAHNVFVDAHRITTGRHRGRLFRGGLTNYEHLARDLTLWMKQDQNEDSWFTTMVDFYALPSDFPGLATCPSAGIAYNRIRHLETELGRDIVGRMGGLPVTKRLIPYIQLHEFEALLFSDPAAFREVFPHKPSAIAQLAAVRARFPTPEDIDDDPRTHPSRQILDVLPDYEKAVAGLLIAQRIGLPVIRRECGHFNEWLTRLLTLLSPKAASADP
jgi:Domain of unknown function (DUF4276)